MTSEKGNFESIWTKSTWEENVAKLKINDIVWNSDNFDGLNPPTGYYDNNTYIAKINPKQERNIKLPKKICTYLKLDDTKITLDKLNNALQIKSDYCKKNYNYLSKTSDNEYVLCNEGKQLFQLKSNVIIKHCLIDLLLYKYNNLPKCDFYDYYQEPIDIKHIILNELKIDI